MSGLVSFRVSLLIYSTSSLLPLGFPQPRPWLGFHWDLIFVRVLIAGVEPCSMSLAHARFCLNTVDSKFHPLTQMLLDCFEIFIISFWSKIIHKNVSSTNQRLKLIHLNKFWFLKTGIENNYNEWCKNDITLVGKHMFNLLGSHANLSLLFDLLENRFGGDGSNTNSLFSHSFSLIIIIIILIEYDNKTLLLFSKISLKAFETLNYFYY